ncbi:MAG: Rpn family recombination-promoting nuclease/putative transposase [Proteobacteria bacterium]|nr:Rpn family recombination-promoting nuclease/putative transposase [Pseudomonadota bacterium]
MGKIDSTSKVFVQKPEVFQDVFKLVFRETQMAIRELKPMDPECLLIQRLSEGGKNKHNRKRHKAQKALLLANFSRDMIKTCLCATDDEADYMILGIENQSYIDRFMPARVMIYDALTFHTQMQTIKAKSKFGNHSSQFLSGVSPEAKLKPVITAVCYFGTKPWDGPRNLHEILDIKNPKLKAFVPDYPICIIDPHTLSDEQLEVLDTSLREVFMCIKASQDRKKLKEIVNSSERFQHVDPDAANLIYAALNINIPIHKTQKEINMCQAVEEWKQELLDEGYANGEKAGIEKGEKAGIDKSKAQIAKNMLNAGNFTLQQIAALTELPLQTVENLA